MKLLAVDSNSILNRAYYGVKPLTTREGLFTNGIYGFLNILFKMCEETQPDAVACCFDLRAPTFRHKLYDGYKAQRKGMPPELAQQLDPLKEVLTLLGCHIVTKEGYEADDLLGTLSALCRQNGDSCVIATGDRDSFQLVDELVTVRLAYTRAGQSGSEVIDVNAIREKYGVAPCQLIEVKALMGDTSDNIPGVAGVGEKTALALIAQFGSLDGVYAHIDDPAIKNAVREKLLRDRETAYLSRQLAEIDCAVPLDITLDELRAAPRQDGALYALLNRLELRSVITRLGLQPGEDAQSPAAQKDAPPPALPVTCNDAAALHALLQSDALWLAADWDKTNAPAALALTDGAAMALLDADCPDFAPLCAAVAEAAPRLAVADSKQWYH